uniref:zinc finger protein ZAT18-like n=1 Tax=Erigeron canadensis TaxID=72917 RepID=UPI001CB97394|nr:zinc finger protein ZAT18-like [Erigeron canadensis]
MPGTKRQLDNIENFARKNATFLAAQQNPKPEKGSWKCKDCTNEYDTFQALGGHRAAAHKFGTLLETGEAGPSLKIFSNRKLHYCNVCGKGFLIGQALGGHMRIHFSKKICRRKVGNSAKIESFGHLDSVSCSKIENVGTSLKKVLKFDLNFTPEENESKNDVNRLEQDS